MLVSSVRNLVFDAAFGIKPPWMACIRNTSEFRPLDTSVTVDGTIRQKLESLSSDRQELQRRADMGEPLYPRSDPSILWRSCEEEVVEPLQGTTTGTIPPWLKGTLLRNGPGCQQFGDSKYEHWFDGAAMVHRFGIAEGTVTYQSRFLQSNTYKTNKAANRIVFSEFGTAATPDPCQSIFHRVSALFRSGDGVTDNAMISIYPFFGDEFYCFTEAPVIHRIDPKTLETTGRVDVSKHVAILNHTSHPHVTEDGCVYNQAMTLQGLCPAYSIVKFPAQDKADGKKSSSKFNSAEVMASVKARWPMHPSYMHSFGITDHYYVIVEQPLTVSLPTMLKNKLYGEALCSCFKYFPTEKCLFHVVERATGKLYRTYLAEPFFYFHVINQFEKDDHLVMDICCYSDAAMIDLLYREAQENMFKNPNYADLMRGRPFRFVLPLAPKQADETTNLVSLAGSSAAASWQKDKVLVTPELLCNMGVEMPRINYDRHLGKPYRYFYAVSNDVDSESNGSLVKVDTWTRATWTWNEKGVFPSEPVFVPSPDSQTEDDGVVLSALVWGQGLEKQVGLLVLDAASWQEVGRTVFYTPSPVPTTLHGWFTSLS